MMVARHQGDIMKIRAEIAPAGEMCRLWMDDKEITQNVSEFHITARVGEPSKIIMALVPREIIIAGGELEQAEYCAPDGQILTEIVNAENLWHCRCGTWNNKTMHLICRVCKHGPPDLSVEE
jgi:hypothetical protein